MYTYSILYLSLETNGWHSLPAGGWTRSRVAPGDGEGGNGHLWGVPWGDGHVISNETPLKTINHGLIIIIFFDVVKNLI